MLIVPNSLRTPDWKWPTDSNKIFKSVCDSNEIAEINTDVTKLPFQTVFYEIKSCTF